jgi:MinD-like ATPase involved in chromosome partitioning or flagellar assembly
MYVVTFYSFKGGVGRTMAMVNVAADLAKRGRRVLMVDFDLEAPGLSDFGLISKKDKMPGLVEFITEYKISGRPPALENFVYQSSKYPETKDRLWVMPAGCQNGDYQTLFSEIGWNDLYENNNGYLLMEDLRAQWEATISPDYVFIDSRTGYTDIAGICTRQLPDAVCLVFVPNRQNLTGLTKITAEIKAQLELPDLRHPKLHFVASNIPTAEDDELVLQRALGNFSRQLEYSEPTAIIHHYNSLALINEAVFTLDYPKNPLSIEYKGLADEITRGNLSDRFTAIEFSNTVIQKAVSGKINLSEQEIDERLSQLEFKFTSDSEVLFWLSRARRSLGNFEESEILLDSAIKNGLNTPRGFLDRIINRINSPSRDSRKTIHEDLSKILEMRSVLPSELLWTIKLAVRSSYENPLKILNSPAISELDSEDIVHLAHKLLDNAKTVELSVELLLSTINSNRIGEENAEEALYVLTLGLIAAGRLEKAIETIGRTKAGLTGHMDVSTLFNLGMAKYWSSEADSNICFEAVMDLLSVETASISANQLQCISFAAFALGNMPKAYSTLEQARTKASEQSGPVFSCWRYLEVGPKLFEEDIGEMKKLYEGEKIYPVFCRNNRISKARPQNH